MHCSCCNHPDRDQLDVQLIEGAPFRRISATFNVSLGAISRHKIHVKEMIKARTDGEQREHGSHLLGRVEKLADEAIGLLESAKAAGNIKGATAAVCAAVRCLELCGRLDGSLAQPHTPGLHLHLTKNTVNINNYNDDVEFALLVKEATKSFDPATIEHLKAVADSAITQP